MPKARILMCVLGAAFVSGLQAGEQRVVQLDRPVQARLSYLLYLPPEYEQRESWPVLLFLHGAGERGDNLELVKKHGPPKLIGEGREYPFIVASPQCPLGRWWQAHELVALIDDLQEKYKVDRQRIYVTGLSMGGFGTWQLAAMIPQRLAAIAPICGGGDTLWARELRQLPVWAFHGAKDNAVPLDRSQAMITALERAGAKPKFTIYPEAGHDSWTESYNNPQLYEWLLEQARPAP